MGTMVVIAVGVGAALVATAFTVAIQATVLWYTSRFERRRRRVRWRMPGFARSLSAALVGTASVSATAALVEPGAAAAASAEGVDDRGPAGAARLLSPAGGSAARIVHAAPVGDAGPSTPLAAAASAGDAGQPVWTVRPGDTLSGIAGSQLGDQDRWLEIWDLNRGRHFAGVGGVLRDPDLIYPGWKLVLPANGGQPSTPPHSSHGEEEPAGEQAAETPRGSATEDRTPTAPACQPAGDDGVFVPPATADPSPPPATGGPSSPSGRGDSGSPHPVGPAESDDGRPQSVAGWIEVTGGVIGVGLAAALVYAAATVWTRRRHRHQPTPITSPPRGDADLAPPLPAHRSLRRQVRRAAPKLLDHQRDPGPTVREYAAASIKPSLPPPGPSGSDLAGMADLPTTTGLGLAGPAAADAARGLLVATLAAGSADDPHAQSRVIIPAPTLAALLDVTSDNLPHLGRLTIAPTFADALASLEEEIIRRSRILADHDAPSISALRTHWTLGEPLPQLLLIADAPDPGWHTRLATTIRLGGTVDVGAVVIGAWPEGTTLSVAADGTTEGGCGERVAVLDTTAATDILSALAEAHGDTDPPTNPPAAAATSPQPSTALPADHDGAINPKIPDRGAAPDPHPDPGTVPAPAAEPAASPAPTRVQGRVLGTPAILDIDGNPVRGLRAKSLELFVYLVVHRDGARLADIMEAIWPDVTVSRAAERLATCVANLRSVIRTIAQTTTEPGAPKIEPVINTGGHYHLDPNLLQVDWWIVEDASARVAAATDDQARLAGLQAAIAAIGGGLADGCDYEWIDTDREYARRRLVTIYAHAAALHIDTDPATALALYDAALALDPLSDELTRRAMRVAARLGDLDGVRARFSALRRALDDAGIDIDPDTDNLATTLLRELAAR